MSVPINDLATQREAALMNEIRVSVNRLLLQMERHDVIIPVDHPLMELRDDCDIFLGDYDLQTASYFDYLNIKMRAGELMDQYNRREDER